MAASARIYMNWLKVATADPAAFAMDMSDCNMGSKVRIVFTVLDEHRIARCLKRASVANTLLMHKSCDTDSRLPTKSKFRNHVLELIINRCP
ncbi:hypothetical protein SE91_26655 [Bradyrhizobium sp. DOA1]|nr:hypothetical protein SE91_26655 [Bradyrhizobium sp. DOA1]